MIKCFSDIKNLAVFTDFAWDREVLDANGRPIYFERLNIIYGRNYSGKTTLSRIVRALEIGRLPDKYVNPQFTVTFADGVTVSESRPSDHGMVVRVFNEDFVRDNLRVLINEDDGIAAFAVLGADNAALVEQLTEKETELGAVDVPGSLLARADEYRRECQSAESAHQQATESLDDLLRNEARKIKEDQRYSDVNYDIRKIKADLRLVRRNSYVPLTTEQVTVKDKVLRESAKETIDGLSNVDLQLTKLESRARMLLSRPIQPSQPIQDLLNNAVLQEWVRRGRQLHEGERITCAFCGNPLSNDLWHQLDRHFSEESETLRSRLESLVNEVTLESEEVASLPPIHASAFYAAFRDDAEVLKNKIENTVAAYQRSLADLKAALEQRLRSIFETLTLREIVDVSESLRSLMGDFEALRTQNNDYTDSLSMEQSKAREALRLDQVAHYRDTIAHDEKQADIEARARKLQERNAQHRNASRTVSEARAAIADLKSRMRDDCNGAEKVNGYLRNYFGHPSLSLDAVPEEEDGVVGYRFELRRDGARAYQLSEGERRLLAFCYFIGRLEDVGTIGTKPIIWIDDPISSLDDNHVFFVYSLIRSQILEKGQYSQLFISTHSLNFLKYLLRVAGPEKKVDRKYFIVDRGVDRSVIRCMPKHLKTFATEFNYLFHRIHKCAHADETSDGTADAFYSFGNDLRKFLEMYLYFRYPDGGKDRGLTRLRRFLGDDRVAALVTDRIENELSHLNALFERAIVPVDVAAMKSMAQLVLERMKAHDSEQYNSLLDSIGETVVESSQAPAVSPRSGSQT